VSAKRPPDRSPPSPPTRLPPNAAELATAAERSTFGGKLGIEIEEWSAERVVGTMPVAGNTQPDGVLHGGATCSLVESLASMGAAGVAGWPAKLVLGLQQSTNFLRAVRDGTVRGVATPVHIGRTTQVWQVDVTHLETGRLVASGRVTLAVRDRSGRPGWPEDAARE
jgi:1,4-dihydroxy-2-naphthoyl-CoA hydrolase